MKSVCLILVVALLVVACSGKKEQKAVAITEDQLPSMVLPLSGFGPDFAGLELDESSGVYTNEQQLADADDPEDEQADQEKFGRLTGFANTWSDATALTEKEGSPFIIAAGVELFRSEQGARSAVQDEVSDGARDLAANDYLGKLIAFNPFNPRIGDSSAGASIHLRAEPDTFGTEDTVDLQMEALFFQRGRVMASIYVIRVGAAEDAKEIKKLAQAMNKRIDAVFQGAEPDDSQAVASTGKPPLSPQDSADARAFLQEAQAIMAGFDTVTVEQSQQVRIQGQAPIVGSSTMTYRMSTSEAYAVVDPGIEMFLVGLDAYLKPPGQNWQCYQDITGFSLKDLGLNPADMKATLDFSDFAKYVTELSRTKFKGEDVRHLKVTMDLEDYFASVAGITGATGDLKAIFDSMEGDEGTVDVYISTAAKQIRQVVANFDMSIDGEKTSITAEGVYTDLGTPFQSPLSKPYPVCRN